VLRGLPSRGIASGVSAGTRAGTGASMSERGEAESSIPDAFRRTGLTPRDMWFRYLALGGNADEVWVEAALDGLLELPPGEYNVLAHALNEELDELPDGDEGWRVAYQQPVSEEDRRGG
jgi:hypothetical protein